LACLGTPVAANAKTCLYSYDLKMLSQPQKIAKVIQPTRKNIHLVKECDFFMAYPG